MVGLYYWRSAYTIGNWHVLLIVSMYYWRLALLEVDKDLRSHVTNKQVTKTSSEDFKVITNKGPGTQDSAQ